MKILAIETSSVPGSVALLDGERLVSEAELPTDRRTAQSLLPVIDEQLRSAGWQPSDLRLVAAAIGPGSFTGLRIGVTAAKTFAYATNAAVLGVNSLLAIAAQARAETSAAEVQVVLEAERGQLVAGRAAFREANSPTLVESELLDSEAWLQQRQPGDVVTGLGLRRIRERIPAGIQVVSPSLWPPRAATVGRLAWQDFTAGRRDDIWTLSPVYYRPSAAEEKVSCVP